MFVFILCSKPVSVINEISAEKEKKQRVMHSALCSVLDNRKQCGESPGRTLSSLYMYEFNSREDTNAFGKTPSHDLRRAQVFHASFQTVILPNFSVVMTWLHSLCT